MQVGLLPVRVALGEGRAEHVALEPDRHLLGAVGVGPGVEGDFEGFVRLRLAAAEDVGDLLGAVVLLGDYQPHGAARVAGAFGRSIRPPVAPILLGSARSMRTLVTGGAGFIGSNLVDALLARGDEVTVVDDLSTGRRENLDGALAGGREAGRAGRPRGRRAGRAGSPSERPEVVFHLAAQIDVRKSLADPAFDAAINVGGTANLLEAARGGGLAAGRLRLHRRRDLRRGRGQAAAARRGRADRTALRLRPEQVRRRGLPGALRAALRALRRQPAARQRLRAAPGPARRGGRDRDLLRQAARPASGRPSTATAGRPATTYMWATWSRRRWPRPARRRAGAINIGTGVETDVLELAARLGELGGRRELRARARAAARRRGAADLARRGTGRARAGLAGRETGLAEGLRLTLDSM